MQSITLNHIHKAAWSEFVKRHGPTTTRNFLFDFRRTSNAIAMQFRLSSDPCPFSHQGRYRLHARFHPVRRESYKAGGKEKTAEHPIQKESLLPWLGAMLRQHGFRLLQVHETVDDPIPLGRGGFPSWSVLVDFTVQVENLELAEQAWKNGIGRMKSFGFGMLVLKQEL